MQNGKGSAPRKGQNPKAYADNWEKLWGKKETPTMKLEEFEDNDGNIFLQAKGKGWSVLIHVLDIEYACNIELLFDTGGRIMFETGPVNWTDNAVYITNLILQDRFGKDAPWLSLQK